MFEIFITLTTLIILVSSGPILEQDGEEDEGRCSWLSSSSDKLMKSVDPLPLLGTHNYFIPMGSKTFYRQYATYLLGRPPKNQSETQAMQLIIRGNFMTLFKTMGYGNKHFYQLCLDKAIPSLDVTKVLQLEVLTALRLSDVDAYCVAYGGSPGTNLKPVAATKDSLVWTNNANVALILRCPINGVRDWKVLSLKPTLSDGDIAIITRKIVDLGFKEENIEYMAYDESTISRLTM